MKVFGLCCLFIASIYASDFWISPKGNNQNAGTSSDSPFQTLSYALSIASTNDSIYCLSGMYSKSGEDVGITIDKQVSILIDSSQPENSVIFSYASSQGAGIIFSFSGDIEVNIIGINFSQSYPFFQETSSTDSVSLQIINCKFSEGGSVSATHLFFQNSIFSYCYNPIYLPDNDYVSLVVDGCTFSNLQFGFEGAAVSVSYLETVRISNSIFEYGGGLGQNGGAIYLRYTDGVIQNCTFRNSSGTSGGAIYTVHSDISVISSFFQSNSATESGGSIYSSFSSIYLYNINFTNSSASDGGALYLDNSAGYMDNVVFNKNSANQGPDCQQSTSSVLYSDLYFDYISENTGNCFTYNN